MSGLAIGRICRTDRIATGDSGIFLFFEKSAGPRKRSRSLRTQQRVWLFFASSTTVHSGKPVVLTVNGALSSPCQCSTLELSLIEHLSMTGSQHLSVPRCSLERR